MVKPWLAGKRAILIRIDQLRGERFFHDRLSLMMLTASLLLNGLTLIQLVARSHPIDYPVPIHYSNITGFDTLQPWYSYYQIGAFGWVVTVVNGLLAIQAFGRSRITSFFLLAGAFVVGLFCLVITTAFLSFIQ